MNKDETDITDMEKELFTKVCNSNKVPEVRMMASHFETAFAVVTPGKNDALCYCTSKSDAELIAHSIKVSQDIAMMALIHKAFI